MLLGAAATVVVVAGIRATAWLIGPVFLALVIVIALSPVQAWLRNKGMPRWLSTVVLVALVYGSLLVLALGILISVARLAELLPRYATRAAQLVDSATSALVKLGAAPHQLRTAAQSLDLGKVTTILSRLLSDVAGLAASLVFLLALLFFFSVESSGIGERIAVIAADRPAMADVLSRFAARTRRYLVVTTVFGLIVAVLDAAALAIVGIPMPITWGLLSFVTNYIPNVGFLIGLAPPAVLGLLIGGPRELLLVVVVYGVLNFVVQSLIQPKFVGNAVGLSATATFVALAFWAWLLGPLGAILAIPGTLLAKAILVDVDPRARWADVLLRASTAKGSAKDADSTKHGSSARGEASAAPAGDHRLVRCRCFRRGRLDMFAKRNSPAWTGWIMFAALMLLIIGCVNVVEGIVGLIYRQRTVLVQHVLYVVNLTGWALALLVFGCILALSGLGLLAVRTWARVVAIVVVALHAIAQIGWLAAYPVWSLLMLALDVVVLYALTARWPDSRDMAAEFTPTATFDSPNSRGSTEREEVRGRASTS